MIIVLLSSSKTMQQNNFRSQSIPFFLTEASELDFQLKKLNKIEITKFYGSSAKLTEKILYNLKDWNTKSHQKIGQAALYAFNGDAFSKLNAANLSSHGKENAHKSIRILSGLYGLLKPLDAIQPYRLDMAQNIKGTGLTSFWKKRLTDQLANQKEVDTIINLASK